MQSSLSFFLPAITIAQSRYLAVQVSNKSYDPTEDDTVIYTLEGTVTTAQLAQVAHYRYADEYGVHRMMKDKKQFGLEVTELKPVSNKEALKRSNIGDILEWHPEEVKKLLLVDAKSQIRFMDENNLFFGEVKKCMVCHDDFDAQSLKSICGDYQNRCSLCKDCASRQVKDVMHKDKLGCPICMNPCNIDVLAELCLQDDYYAAFDRLPPREVDDPRDNRAAIGHDLAALRDQLAMETDKHDNERDYELIGRLLMEIEQAQTEPCDSSPNQAPIGAASQDSSHVEAGQEDAQSSHERSHLNLGDITRMLKEELALQEPDMSRVYGLIAEQDRLQLLEQPQPVVHGTPKAPSSDGSDYAQPTDASGDYDVLIFPSGRKLDRKSVLDRIFGIKNNYALNKAILKREVPGIPETLSQENVASIIGWVDKIVKDSFNGDLDGSKLERLENALRVQEAVRRAEQFAERRRFRYPNYRYGRSEVGPAAVSARHIAQPGYCRRRLNARKQQS